MKGSTATTITLMIIVLAILAFIDIWMAIHLFGFVCATIAVSVAVGLFFHWLGLKD